MILNTNKLKFESLNVFYVVHKAKDGKLKFL